MADHKPGGVEIIRAITRPILTFSGLLLWGSFIGTGVAYPEAFQWVVVTMVAWWFGDRTLRNWQKRGKKE